MTQRSDLGQPQESIPKGRETAISLYSRTAYHLNISTLPFTLVTLAFFANPLLYHSLPTTRTVVGPDGKRRSIAVTPQRTFGFPDPAFARRNTIAVVDRTNATADPSSFQEDYTDQPRRNTLTSATGDKGSSMSKVVRSVKNVTKGYSSVQVKVRNGTHVHSFDLYIWLILSQRPRTTHGVRPAPIWLRSQL